MGFLSFVKFSGSIFDVCGADTTVEIDDFGEDVRDANFNAFFVLISAFFRCNSSICRCNSCSDNSSSLDVPVIMHIFIDGWSVMLGRKRVKPRQ